MREGWVHLKIKDISSIITKGTTPSTYGFDFEDDGEVNFIRAEGISKDGRIDNSTFLKITKECNHKLKRSIINENDILFSIAGMALGKSGLVKKEHLPANTNQAVAIIRPNEIVLPKFLLYYIVNPSFYTLVNSISGQAAQPNINLKQVGSLPILLPPLETQRKIAKILSNYDDLIENNLKRIKLLEEMAQQTFRNFVKNGNAKNWKSKSLETLIDFHIGGGWGEEELSSEFSESGYVIRGTDIDALKKGENSKVPHRFHKISNIRSRQLEDGDIVFEVSGGSSNEGVAKSFLITHEVLKFFNDKVICASFCKLIRLKDRSLSHFFYYFLQYLRESKTTEIYEKRSASNIVNYNWEAFLKYQKILLPNPNEIKEFNDKVIKILKLINLLGAQNQRLREARDILLPRLMMGLVDVHDIDL